LNIPRRTKRRIPKREPVPLAAGSFVNQGWALDFMHDVLYDGRRFSTLNVIDQANREALAINHQGSPVTACLDADPHDGPPGGLVWPAAVDAHGQRPGNDQPRLRRVGAAPRGIVLNYIEPGEHNQNAYIERFNRTFRTEVLDAYLSNSIEQVQAIADDWLTQYNEYRPHDALGGVLPKQFMPRLITTTAADSRNQLSA
jgi:putative transposase